MKAKALGLVAGLALGCGAIAPAEAQFLTNYPVIVVPPPQAQTIVVPKSSPTTTQLNKQFPASPNTPPDTNDCTYQGRVKICK
jgi:hypothetical protein